MTFSTDIYGSCSDGALYCLSLWVNGVTSGLFWTLILLGFLIVLIMVTISRLGTTRAIGFAGTMGIFATFFLLTLGLMPWSIASMFFIAGGASIVALVLNEK